MRQVLRASTLVLAALVTTGCLVSSLHPVYEDDSIVFDEALIGEWENRESDITVVVSRSPWRSYEIAYTDRFGTTLFTGHLTALGAAHFMNILPKEGLDKPPFIVATNGIVQIRIEPDRLHIREPEYAVLLARSYDRKLGIDAATDMKQNLIITAPSSTLRKWLASALKDETLWTAWRTLTRSAR